MSNQIDDLAENRCQSLVGPAGYGKSESIAQALKIADGRQLILTHTHAGVRSLRNKFHKYKIPQSKYVLETIHGFFLKYAASYPSNSGIDLSAEKYDLWDEIIPAFNRLLDLKLIRQVLQCSYKGVFVDEYQDCTLRQHHAIMKISESLPVRILGDPLQGIFDFNPTDPIVDWGRDVGPNFPELNELQTSWRWVGKNGSLGDWLKNLRTDLLLEKEINLMHNMGAFIWKQNDSKNFLLLREASRACINCIPTGQSFVAIQQFPKAAHDFARSQEGQLQSMEEMECRDLFKSLSKFENTTGSELVQSVFEFIKQCTIMKKYLSDVELQVKRTKRSFDFTRISDPTVRSYIYSIYHDHDYFAIASLIDFTFIHKGEDVFRRELMAEMSKSLKEYCDGEFDSIADAAWEVRTRTRIRGQNIPRKIVSRPHLIKGLEFDNALVLNADKIKNAKYFYVCLTRACYSMTILSENPIVHFKLT